MRAWVFALGKPFVCCIVGHEGVRFFLYYHDEKDPIEGKVIRIKKCLCITLKDLKISTI